ncbi:hypothetical protein G9464_01070 [Halostella sp. JP-L12]|uniref:Zn-ribbon domain-containing protein n=1 Tax=Halostella TaxID=1843185 RepID=UPI000EF7791F|nr:MULTISPECIES: Zn-ribbon containing protein [Halostella]NHN46190.1 hypothetical protein [Halostella sp. JP-L12]
MPHQCTNCGRTFADGSKEMLSGCPDCGGNKFQFEPAGRSAGAEGDAPETEASAGAADAESAGASSSGASRSAAAARDAPRSSADAEGGVAGKVNRARETVRDWVGTDRQTDERSARSTDDRSTANAGRSDTAGGPSNASAERPDGPATADQEDSAQANARSDVVSRDELPDDPPEPPREPAAGEGARVVDEPDDADAERPDLSELREELNNQFESIKIVQPGQYELNLMELYDRDEYIISLKEDGRYVIEVPETWRSPDE